MASLLEVEIGQFSAAGKKPHNQDAVAARLPQGSELAMKGTMLALADGISSSACSQIAAETSVKNLLSDYYATPQAWAVRTSARRVIESLNSWLFAQNRHARTADLNKGLVCTLSALVLKGHQAHIFHLGDSRVSRFLGGSLEPLTEDHVSHVGEGEVLLTRAMGIRERVDIDYVCHELRVGDVFLLSSDGVHDHITAADVADALAAETLDAACKILAEKAVLAGSEDNVSAQLVQVIGLPSGVPYFQERELPIPRGLCAGSRLDGFELLRELHHTPRSQLMLAVTEGGERAVIKVPSVETAERPEHLQRFLFEEWVAHRIDSPHVVKAFPEQSRSASYVALEYIEGCTLRQWMQDTPRPPTESVRSILEQLVVALRRFHRLEMIHQDLRPENVMVDNHGVVKLIDLGSVAVPGLEEAAPGFFGLMPGTFQYTAPEYLSGDAVSWRADQYALGAIAYEMLTGVLPYGTQVAKVRNRSDQRRLKYRHADEGENGVAEWIDFALAKACHRDPHRRYDTLEEFLLDLRRPSNAFTPRQKRPLIQRHPVRVWQGVALIQAVVIVWLLLRL